MHFVGSRAYPIIETGLKWIDALDGQLDISLDYFLSKRHAKGVLQGYTWAFTSLAASFEWVEPTP
jgi:hypothetical protein